MSSSAADTLVVDRTQTLGRPPVDAGNGDDACIRELIIRRQIPSSSFCMNPQLQTHPYDRPPPRPPRVNRQLHMQNPTMASLINTVAEARNRKRLREEEIYIKRQVGSQTEPQEGDPPREEPDYYTRQNGISCTRRLHRETIPPSAPPDTITRESIGTNTTPPPPPDPIPSDPSPSEPSSSSQPCSSRTHSDHPSSSYRASSRLYNLTPSTQQVIRAAQRRRERESRGSRRERRERYQQNEAQRILLETQVQQIEGVIPGHTCNVNCPHYHQILANMAILESNAPATGPHAVSPTLAPGAFMRGGHPLATATNFPIHYPIPTYTHPPTMQVPAVLTYYYPTIPTVAPPSAPVPVTAPPPPVQAPPTIHAPVPIRPPPPATLYGPARDALSLQGTLQYLEFLQHHNYGLLFPTFDRMLDRHHMFAGLDIDVPVGAPKSIVDVFAVEAQYEKKNGEEEVEACTVCLNDFVVGESIRKLPCNHVFHPECIYKWLEINKKCPMCREDIDKSRAATDPN